MRLRFIRAFEYSILPENFFYDRVQRIAVEIMERYWAAKYPECVDTPCIQVYDLSRRGEIVISAGSVTPEVLYELSDKFEIPMFVESGRSLHFSKQDIESL